MSLIKALARKELTRAARRMSIQNDLARNALEAVAFAEAKLESAPEEEKDAIEKVLAERYMRYDFLRTQEVDALNVLELAIKQFKGSYKITSKENE